MRGEKEPPSLRCTTESGRACERPPIQIEIREGAASDIDKTPTEVLCVLDRESFVYIVRNSNVDLRYLNLGMNQHGEGMFANPSKERAAAKLQLCPITWGAKFRPESEIAFRVAGAAPDAEACTGRTVYVGAKWSSIVEEKSLFADRYLVQVRLLPN